MNALFDRGQFSIASFEGYLTENGIVAVADLDRAREAASASNSPLLTAIVDLGLVTDDDLCASLQAQTGLEREISLTVDVARAGQLGWSFLRNARVAPLQAASAEANTEGHTKSETACRNAVFAVADPFDAFTLKSLALAVKEPLEIRLALSSDILAAIDAAEEATEAPDGPEATFSQGAADEDVALLKERASEAPVIQLGIQLFDKAVDLRATDMHLEATPQGLRVRYRVDGALQEDRRIAKAQAPALVSRLKLLAGVDIAEGRLPQDGRIKTTVRGRAIDMRLATLPSHHGESIVVRLLDQSRITLSLPKLGFGEAAQRTLSDLTDQTGGIILVTGPTGSGKTTTLYSLLDMVRGGDRKIITVEDPIEYELDGLTQVQVRPQIDLTFARVLRATLRHDPDILLVGEIRDGETARVAVEAALTGHLVLATLHTNSASAAPARLIDMGVEDYLLASTLSAVVGQRLIRTLCGACKKPEPLGTAVASRYVPLAASQPDRAAVPVGCATCNQTGYAGRTVIYEIMQTSAAVRAAILNRTDANALEDSLRATGFQTMRQCGAEKALRGDVALADVLIATGDGA